MGAALPFVAVAAIGASAYGQIASSRQASAAAKYNSGIASQNAQIANQNATWTAQEGDVKAGIEEQKTRATVGSIRANQAAGGVDVNTGSAVDVRASAAALGMQDAMTIRSNAARQAYGFQTQSASDTAQAQLDRKQASHDIKAGYIGAATTLLSGGASAGEKGAFDSWMGNNSVLSSVTTGPGAVTEGTGGLY